jgi:Na+-transporting NADH:ubiquinone oxidoreductase subunit A
MAAGIPLHERIIAIGGPGLSDPCHVRARIGTPLQYLLPPQALSDNNLVLKGGLFRGVPARPSTTGVDAKDDAFFVIPRPAEREFLGFVKLGFDRVSILPCFGSALTGSADRHLSDSLRGERRPCIACGVCEDICPMGLMPQVLHRYLYRDALDEAEKTGLPLCIGCGLCSYVCPSKIELRHEFAEAQNHLRLEQEQAAADKAQKPTKEGSMAGKEDSEVGQK